MLFKISTPNDIDETIDELALKAAIDFIEVCCDHAFMIIGRHNILHRVENNEDGDGKYVYIQTKYALTYCWPFTNCGSMPEVMY